MTDQRRDTSTNGGIVEIQEMEESVHEAMRFQLNDDEARARRRLTELRERIDSYLEEMGADE